MRRFNSECDPAHEYLTACACFPPRSVSPWNSLSLSASLFSSSVCLFLSIVTFQEFPPGRLSDTHAKERLFSSIFPQKSCFLPPIKAPKTENILHKYIDWPWISCPIFSPPPGTYDLACTWRLTFWPLPSRSWPLNSPLIIRPSPPMNLLPRGSWRKQALVTQRSIGKPWREPITAVTWWVTCWWNHVSSIFEQISASLRPVIVSEDTGLRGETFASN